MYNNVTNLIYNVTKLKTIFFIIKNSQKKLYQITRTRVCYMYNTVQKAGN